jgi:hypothetical protein
MLAIPLKRDIAIMKADAETVDSPWCAQEENTECEIV